MRRINRNAFFSAIPSTVFTLTLYNIILCLNDVCCGRLMVTMWRRDRIDPNRPGGTRQRIITDVHGELSTFGYGRADRWRRHRHEPCSDGTGRGGYYPIQFWTSTRSDGRQVVWGGTTGATGRPGGCRPMPVVFCRFDDISGRCGPGPRARRGYGYGNGVFDGGFRVSSALFGIGGGRPRWPPGLGAPARRVKGFRTKHTSGWPRHLPCTQPYGTHVRRPSSTCVRPWVAV